MNSCIIIGAGMAGLTAARELTNYGWEVTILDKGRGVGGRMATRRIDHTRADHGAQYFSVRTPEFRQLLDQLTAEGIAEAWDLSEAGIEYPRYFGAQGMSTIPKYLAQGLNIALQERAILIEGDEASCRVTTESGNTFRADALLLTIPAPQALTLLGDSDLNLPEAEQGALQAITYQPCLAVIALLNQPSRIPAPGMQILETGGIEKVIDNQQKGIAPEQATVTIHATPAFSVEHLEGDLRAAGQKLLDQLTEWVPAESVTEYQVHRWRYSLAEVRHPEGYLEVPMPFPTLLGGDGFGMGNVEGAFQSGRQMARALIEGTNT
ncbi:NAD(P)/FAD-dependent oxidoreductase [Salmonirosea aquatica]|uniref:FAD-dependent oxidoreductase n=1 Tax=Salmonirosea aquatica TaxID=2654236 RepID=A0A7C9F9I7_9BACT|nr:FAD-dependent oxidoreductase [Cytophagaceae bacterium SJW1-29]